MKGAFDITSVRGERMAKVWEDMFFVTKSGHSELTHIKSTMNPFQFRRIGTTYLAFIYNEIHF